MGGIGVTSACTMPSTLRPPVDQAITLPAVPSWDSTARTRSLTLKLMLRGQLLLLLCWTAQTTFPYSRTSFLTASKTGWIVFLKGPLIGTMSTTGQNFPFSLYLEQQIDKLCDIQFCFQSLRLAMFIIVTCPPILSQPMRSLRNQEFHFIPFKPQIADYSLRPFS